MNDFKILIKNTAKTVPSFANLQSIAGTWRVIIINRQLFNRFQDSNEFPNKSC